MSMKIKELPKIERPREKLIAKGPQNLKDEELLAILLRTGYRGKSAIEIAKRIIDNTSLNKLIKMSPQKISKIKGVGKSRAATITAAFSLFGKFNTDKNNLTVTSSGDAVKIVQYLATKKKEHFVGIYLDGRDQLINTKIISVGTLTENLVHPREVFLPAIIQHAASLYVAHNHPSGDPEPSEYDLLITKRLEKSGKILGINLVDHLIIAKDKYFSFKEKGLINGDF